MDILVYTYIMYTSWILKEYETMVTEELIDVSSGSLLVMGMKPNFKVSKRFQFQRQGFRNGFIKKTRVSKRFQFQRQGFRNSFSFKDNGFDMVSVSIYVFR